MLFGLEEEFNVLRSSGSTSTPVKVIIEQMATGGAVPGVWGVHRGGEGPAGALRVKDLPASGQTVELWWRKRRLVLR